MRYALLKVTGRGPSPEFIPQWRRGEQSKWTTFSAFSGAWGFPGHELPLGTVEEGQNWLQKHAALARGVYEGIRSV